MDTIFETVQHLSNNYSLLAFFVTTLIAVQLYIENSRKVRLANKLPGPLSLPLIGNAYLGIGQTPYTICKLALEYHKKYGSVARVYSGTKILIFLTHSRDIEVILGSSVHLDKSVEYRFFQPWLGDGLLITSGDKWHRHRKVIAPTFHISILKSFVPLFYENSIELVRRLRDKIGKEFDCHDYLSAVTVDILIETVMGVKREKRPKSGYDYAMAVMKLSDIIHRRHYNLWCFIAFQLTKYHRHQKKLLKIVHALTNTVIKVKSEDVKEKFATEKKENQQNEKPTEKVENDNSNYTKLHYVKDDLDDIDENDVGNKKRLAFLETLITMKQKDEQMTDEEIWEEVNTIMFEGHDTTAAGSSFALCVLGCLSDVQARVHEELDAIFGDSDRQCTFSDTVEMKYLERVIMETLRLFPPVPIIARRINEDVKLVTNDYVIPKDVTVVIAQLALHRLEEFYPNPEDFNPDNFLPERMQQRPYYSYIPFSAGPRSCVGRKYAMLKLKVLLSTILRNYRIISDKHYKDFKLQADIILKRQDGFMIRIEPRKPAASRESNSTPISVKA